MKIEWLNHTGYVVADMERALSFYRDLLGFKEERNQVLEGEFISGMIGFPDTKIHAVYLGIEDMRHSVELIQYINPPGEDIPPSKLNQGGATHLGVIVEDLDSVYEELTAEGVKFNGPPSFRANAEYPWARKVCMGQDLDGNWLEFIERPPATPGTTKV